MVLLKKYLCIEIQTNLKTGMHILYHMKNRHHELRVFVMFVNALFKNETFLSVIYRYPFDWAIYHVLFSIVSSEPLLQSVLCYCIGAAHQWVQSSPNQKTFLNKRNNRCVNCFLVSYTLFYFLFLYIETLYHHDSIKQCNHQLYLKTTWNMLKYM